METPSGQLAARILKRLVEEKLLRPNDQDKLLDNLAVGKLKSEDWQLAIELAQAKEKEA